MRAKYDRVVDGFRDNFRDKPRWITEIGFPSRGGAGVTNVSSRTQCRRVRVAYLKYADRNRIKTFIVHRPFDDRSQEANDFGLINHDLAADPPDPSYGPRPGYLALAERVVGTGFGGC